MDSKKRLTISVEDLEDSWLPDDIMYLIMSKLMEFPIYLARFSAVCKYWHRLVCDSWPKLVKENKIITPLVFVPLLDRKKAAASYRIRNLTEKYPLELVNSLLPCEPSAQIIGSSFGWLIISSEDKNNETLSLFNPLSKYHIRLPFLECNPFGQCKGVLSKPPPHFEEEDQHFDIAITMKSSKIAFLHVEKIGELQSLHWVHHHHIRDQILDVSSIGGRICILHSSGSISCNYSTDRFYSLDGEYCGTAHLLESSSSEPLVVFRYDHFEYGVGFKILFLTGSGNDKELKEIWNWSEIKTHDAIFLSCGKSDSICIQAGSNVAAGSIYFTNKDFDIGVFNVGKNGITHYHSLGVTKFLHRYRPIWLLPYYDKMLKFTNIS